MRAAAGVLAVLALLAPAGIASAAPPPSAPRSADYPTWDEVQQARADAAAAAAMVTSIGALLDQLQAESARLNDQALERAMGQADNCTMAIVKLVAATVPAPPTISQELHSAI